MLGLQNGPLKHIYVEGGEGGGCMDHKTKHFMKCTCTYFIQMLFVFM